MGRIRGTARSKPWRSRMMSWKRWGTGGFPGGGRPKSSAPALDTRAAPCGNGGMEHRHPDLDPTAAADDPVEYSLRPQRLGEYIGQEKVKARLEIALQAAKQRGE